AAAWTCSRSRSATAVSGPSSSAPRFTKLRWPCRFISGLAGPRDPGPGSRDTHPPATTRHASVVLAPRSTRVSPRRTPPGMPRARASWASSTAAGISTRLHPLDLGDQAYRNARDSVAGFAAAKAQYENIVRADRSLTAASPLYADANFAAIKARVTAFLAAPD